MEDNINIKGYPETDIHQFCPVCRQAKLEVRGKYAYLPTPDSLPEFLVPVFRGKSKPIGCPLWAKPSLAIKS